MTSINMFQLQVLEIIRPGLAALAVRRQKEYYTAYPQRALPIGSITSLGGMFSWTFAEEGVLFWGKVRAAQQYAMGVIMTPQLSPVTKLRLIRENAESRGI